MCLVHYVFIALTQHLLPNRPVHASLKFLIVFAATTLLSWLTADGCCESRDSGICCEA